MRPIFDLYISGVSTSSQEEFCQTVIKWLNECCCLPKLRPSKFFTATNATDLLRVVNFTSLLKLVNRLERTCQFYQNATIRGLFFRQLAASLWITSFDNQRAASMFDNLQQTVVASHANKSWYWLVDNKSVARSRQTCCKLIKYCVYV